MSASDIIVLSDSDDSNMEVQPCRPLMKKKARLASPSFSRNIEKSVFNKVMEAPKRNKPAVLFNYPLGPVTLNDDDNDGVAEQAPSLVPPPSRQVSYAGGSSLAKPSGVKGAAPIFASTTKSKSQKRRRLYLDKDDCLCVLPNCLSRAKPAEEVSPDGMDAMIVEEKEDPTPREVQWNEPKEIYEATLAVCAQRAVRAEFFPHPLIFDQIRTFMRHIECTAWRMRRIMMWTLADRAILIKKKKLFGKSQMRTEDAVRRLIAPDSYHFSSKLRPRILVDRDISKGVEIFPVAVYSDVPGDQVAPLPDNLQYIKENKYPDGFMDNKELTYSCNCTGLCNVECPCIKANMTMNPDSPYLPAQRYLDVKLNEYENINGEFYKPPHVMCGSLCSCSSHCNIRYPYQAGHKFEVFKRNPKMGYGLRVLNNIMNGEYIMEFTGEVILDPTVNHPRLDDLNDYSYLVADRTFKCKDKNYGEAMRRCSDAFPDKKDKILKYKPQKAHIMPYTMGNVARFAAHGCLPNAIVRRFMVNDIRPETYRLFVFACEDIPAGTEIFIDYGLAYEKRFDCCCGTPLCSNEEQLRILSSAMENTTVIDVLKVFELRSRNVYLQSGRMQEFFASREYATANGQPVPDINDFLLEVTDSEGEVSALIEQLKKPDPKYRLCNDPIVKKAADLLSNKSLSRRKNKAAPQPSLTRPTLEVIDLDSSTDSSMYANSIEEEEDTENGIDDAGKQNATHESGDDVNKSTIKPYIPFLSKYGTIQDQTRSSSGLDWSRLLPGQYEYFEKIVKHYLELTDGTRIPLMKDEIPIIPNRLDLLKDLLGRLFFTFNKMPIPTIARPVLPSSTQLAVQQAQSTTKTRESVFAQGKLVRRPIDQDAHHEIDKMDDAASKVACCRNPFWLRPNPTIARPVVLPSTELAVQQAQANTSNPRESVFAQRKLVRRLIDQDAHHDGDKIDDSASKVARSRKSFWL